jgi:hypothetical protein
VTIFSDWSSPCILQMRRWRRSKNRYTFEWSRFLLTLLVVPAAECRVSFQKDEYSLLWLVRSLYLQRIWYRHLRSSGAFLLDGVFYFHYSNGSFWLVQPLYLCRGYAGDTLEAVVPFYWVGRCTICIHYSNGGFWLVKPLYLAEGMLRTLLCCLPIGGCMYSV